MRIDPALRVSLPYRAPYPWQEVLSFLAFRQIEGVEQISDSRYRRVIAFSPCGDSSPSPQPGIPEAGIPDAGILEVTHDADACALLLQFPASMVAHRDEILRRTSIIFDVNAEAALIDPAMGDLAGGLQGMRVPGVYDGFEAAVRAITGQQISVVQARRVWSRIAGRFGAQRVDTGGVPSALPAAASNTIDPIDPLISSFPLASQMRNARVDELMPMGMTRIRAEAILAIARAIDEGSLCLDGTAPLEPTLDALRAIRGVGEWTVQYIAMRALSCADAFPHGDAVLKRHLGFKDSALLLAHAARWSPWRAYATVHLWRASGTK